jgi:uncharacterized protein YdhG (YjbR/CyaY superfamily)
VAARVASVASGGISKHHYRVAHPFFDNRNWGRPIPGLLRLLFPYEKSPIPCPASPAKPPAAHKTVEEYLAAVPEPARSTLNKVRARIKETTILAVAPAETTEVISYRIPAFKIDGPKYKGILMWYAAFSDHCSLFPTASVIKRFKKDLKDFHVSKGTIHFGVSSSGKDKDKPLPAALLKKMVKVRLAEMEGKKRRG